MDYRQLPAIFIADSPGLDFLNSVATPADEAFDWLCNGEGLLGWLEQAGWVPKEALEAIHRHSTAAEVDEIAAKARELREWFRGFVQKRKGKPLAARDLRELEPLNRLLEQDEQYGKIVVVSEGDGKHLQLHAHRRWRSAASLLMPIAEALARLVCDEDFTYVKACEGPACTLVFVDHTRGHARRWCSMAICGNRAKVAAHRKRLKERENG